MILYFTKGDSLFSKAIMWGLNEPCSHFAISFKNDSIVFHSNILGCHISSAKSFFSKSKVVFTMNFDLSLEQEEEVYQKLTSDYEGKPYDFGAFFYFSYRVILNKLFSIPFPKINKLGNKKSFLCTGLASALPKSVFIKVDFEIVSPYRLYNLLKDYNLGLVRDKCSAR